MKNHLEILEILRDLYKVSGFRVSIHNTDYREIYAYPTTGSTFCATVQQKPAVLAACQQCDVQMLQKVRESGETLLYRCPQGLYEAAAPIYHYGVLSGFLMIGQVRNTADNAFQQICNRATEILGDRQLAETITAGVPAMDEATIRSFLSIITVMAEYLTQTNRVQATSGKLAELLEQYLRRHFRERITLNTLSEQFGYCNATMTKTFRKEYGVTIFNFLRTIRLEHAATLLKDTNKTIKEISEACGIEDQNYFSRVFTEEYGCSPTVYRERSSQT